jgi:hypothetical protein
MRGAGRNSCSFLAYAIGRRTCRWRINDSKTRERLGEIKKNLNAAFTPNTEKGRAMLQIQKDAFNNCTSLVFYTYAPEPSDPHRYDMGSVWLLIENLCLAAVEDGLGTQIVAFWDDAEKEVDQLLGIPEKYRQVVALNMGVPHPSLSSLMMPSIPSSPVLPTASPASFLGPPYPILNRTSTKNGNVTLLGFKVSTPES